MPQLPPDKVDYARHLRKNQTEAEVALWASLRARQIDGFKFRRQAAIGDFITDFVCFEAKLIVEVDGAHHETKDVIEYDQRRKEWLVFQEFQVLRFRNAEVLEDFDSVRKAIRDALNERGKGTVNR
jgi:very-short-patch-repair endonuclease